MPAEVMSVSDLLSLNLRVPGYQRPYRWSTKNVSELLGDIDAAISGAKDFLDYRYRIGTVILHKNAVETCLDVVDGQQRLLTLTLLMLCLYEHASFPLLDHSSFSNRESQRNLATNYRFILDWVGYQSTDWRREARKAFESVLETVVITVDDIEETFQLFDSQNTRGRTLDPHDLLKAYHLRAMRGDPYGMRHVVTRWEEFNTDDVRALFDRYLFPIERWDLGEKARPFTTKEIDAYKGVEEKSGYSYAARARRAAPNFQIGEPFIEGEDFFHMVEHYLRMWKDMVTELRENPNLEVIRKALFEGRPSVGYRYACGLFLCTLFAYYDRFHNFDVRAVRKLFSWAMMIRVDMQVLGFDSVNKYAIGEDNHRFTNTVPMFKHIAHARHHTDVADIVIMVAGKVDFGSLNDERRRLYDLLLSWSKGGAR